MKAIYEKYLTPIYILFASIFSYALYFSIFKDYVFSDAYESLWTGSTSDSYLNAFIVGGRPLYGYLSVWLLGDVIESYEGLKWLRMFSGFMSVLFSAQIFHFLLKKLDWQKYEAALFSVLVLCVPSFTLYFGWSITYEVPIALSLSFLAGVLLYSVIVTNKGFVWRLVVGVMLVLSSLCLYQAAAMAFLIPFVFHFVCKKDFNWKYVIYLAALFVISFVSYYFLFKYSLTAFELKGTPRSQLDWVGFVKRFFGFYNKELSPIIVGSGIILYQGFFKFFGYLLILAFVSLLAYFVYDKRIHWLVFVFLILAMPLSYLPNLLSVDRWISSRTMAPIAIIVLFYQFYFLRHFVSLKIVKYAAMFLAFAFSTAAYYNQNYALAGLQAIEYKTVRPEIEKAIDSGAKRIAIIRPDFDFVWQHRVLKRMYMDEFGIVSNSRDWVPIPLINQVIKEKTGKVELQKSHNHPIPSNQIVMENYSLEQVPEDLSHAYVIDINQLMIDALVEKDN
jgi:hypothetical protein